ncbi:MAG: Efflux ABC transporter, permease protein [Candidatus Woesebacteria bacterium GW2011_GWC2_47_16]|uniref:Cell division protein FtsX n=4 Tax=Candidatus Woeseibacteriota TaxID=1752722 RepID=A0A0G1SNW5_9BACT|nr:MAG: Efflux ABC transporter, permease protein [Candidatus Woesebacteria bacterium GW2011_GWE1_45_18]KKU64753.1 MAG: Efflux ABC transporter, permease protein [Candidatus Woesebacteria bacterium GW2011_GWC2_47_16]KKU71137.1 MAG: Efflux ABC transporter, permease protein [Candidatus Woesebacteria bacterium GW2011_GWD1_47_21]
MKIHLKTALDYIKRSPFQALAALFVLTLTFFVGTILAVLVYSSANLLNYFETRPQIITFLKDEITPENVSALQNKLSADVRVKDVRYVSKEEALEIYKQATSDNPLLSELVSPTIFPASLEFSVTDLSFAQEVINEIKEEGIVDSVGFTASLGGEKTLEDVVGRLRTLTLYLRIGGGVFVGVLAGTSLLVILVITGMRITTRRGEIEILNLIGATPAFIRSPIILEALIYSSVGAFVGWLLAFLIWLYATPALIGYFGDIPILPKGTLNLFGLFAIILVGELIIGLGLALSGSYLAVSRARRNR